MRQKAFLHKNWHWFALALIVCVSFALNFWAISKSGYGNTYYAAAIKSMLQSFKNFFFVSFDPAGMVSVDKPPLGLWIQALFCMIFGYHGWAMLLPQALAGTGSCILMYFLTARYFGKPAGLISSLVFAFTPVVVVASRNNTMDMQLIFFLLVATWFLFKSIETSKARYLYLCALFVGLGFNIKMLQAYMIIPAVVLAYLIFAKGKLYRKIISGVIGLVIMLAVSFAWVFAVDFTPASNRPYVGSSTDNTVLELIIGHNGVERIYGQNRGNRGWSSGLGFGPGFGTDTTRRRGEILNGAPPFFLGQNQNDGASDGAARPESNAVPQGLPDDGMGGGPGRGQMPSNFSGGFFGNEIGTAGVLRLWSSNLYGQVSWLIVFVIFCVVALFKRSDLKKLTMKHGALAYWVAWLAVMYDFFSFAGFYHRYYLCMLAPAIAGLAGPGMMEMIAEFKSNRSWRQFILPVAFTVTSLIAILYVWGYSALRTWLVPVMAIFAILALIFMVLNYIKPNRLRLVLMSSCLLVSLLAAPFYWSLTNVIYVPLSFTMPYAGPELASEQRDSSGKTDNQEEPSTLEKYLVSHYKAGSYLVVAQSSNEVAQYIIDTGLPAVAYGGFTGSDNALTVEQLKQLVEEGKVTYFLVTGHLGGTGSDLISYVEKNATLINPSEYGQTNVQKGGIGMGFENSAGSLYLFK